MTDSPTTTTSTFFSELADIVRAPFADYAMSLTNTEELVELTTEDGDVLETLTEAELDERPYSDKWGNRLCPHCEDTMDQWKIKGHSFGHTCQTCGCHEAFDWPFED